MDEAVGVMNALGRDGFCVLPLLNTADVDRLSATCDALHPTGGAGFETDFEKVDADFKRRVADETAWVWDRLPEYLGDHRAFMSSFLLKWPTEDSQLDLHADWSYVDESRWRTLAVWVPLVDTGPDHDNGTLMVVPGSHHLVRSWRGTSTPPWYGPGYAGFTRAAVPVTAAAGDAVIFDNRLLHYSPPNRSRRVRPVLAGALAPVGAPLIHVLGDGDDGATILSVDSDFFCRWSPTALRANPPSPNDDDRTVAGLVEGELDPWILAAAHGLDDPAAFRGAAAGALDNRWGAPDEPGSRSLLEAAVRCRDAIGPIERCLAPLSFVEIGPSALKEAVLAEAGRPTPLGCSVDDRSTGSPAWLSLRVLQIPPGCDEDLLWPADAATGVIALEAPDRDLPVVIRGEDGWTSIDATTPSTVPPGRVRITNPADRHVHLLVGEVVHGASWSRSLRTIPARYGRRRRRRHAVELVEAVAR